MTLLPSLELLVLAQATPEPISQQGGLLEPFLKYLLPLLLTGVSVLVGMALAALSARAKAQADRDSAAHKAISAAAFLAKMAALAQSAFAAVDTAMRPKISAASADGRITAEELASLKRDALSLLKTWIGENVKAEAEVLLGIVGSGFESWLAGLVASQATGGTTTTTTTTTSSLPPGGVPAVP
jgi:hypothetical protein